MFENWLTFVKLTYKMIDVMLITECKERGRKKRMKKTLAGLLAAAMLVTGCGSSETSYDPKNFIDYIQSSQDVTTFNYLTTYQAVDSRVNANVVSGLTENNKYGEIVGDLAESWETDENSHVWTFHLRDGIKWYNRDGSEYGDVTADDFVYSAEYILDPANQSMQISMLRELVAGAEEYYQAMVAWDEDGRDEASKPSFENVGIKAVDEKTIQYTTTGAGKPYFLSATMYSCFYPAPRAYVEDLTNQGLVFGNTMDTILYNGCYLLDSFQLDTEKVFKKNPGYWDAENVTFDTVTVIAVKDRESTLDLFERGELSYADLAGTQINAEYDEGNPYLMHTDPSATAYVMFLNNECANANTAAAIQNENFRKALFYGFDRKSYTEITEPIDPESIYTYGYTASNVLTTTDGTDYTQLGDLAQWHTDQYNVELAKEYMATARTELEAQGVTFPIELPWYSSAGNETAGQTAAILKSTLEENLGSDNVTVTLSEYSVSFRTDVAYDNLQAMAGAGWAPDYLDPINILGTFRSNGQMNNAEDITAGQYSHFNDPTFDQMIAEADAIVDDLDARYLAFANAEAYLLEHAYFIPLYAAGSFWRVSSINEYSRPYSKSGISGYRYKGYEAYDHAITTEEQEAFKEAWHQKRVELGLVAE